MTVENILEMGLIEDDTEIFIRDSGLNTIAHGNWFQDNILARVDDEVECFTWQDDKRFFIDVKKETK